MKAFDYFKRTFIATFVFIIVYKIVIQLFDGFVGINLEFSLKTFLTAIVTALILGILNYFFKVDFSTKKNNN